MHSVPTSKLLSRELLARTPSPTTSLITALASKLSVTSTTKLKTSGTHPFNLLARILKDPRLSAEKPGEDVERFFDDTIERRGDVIREYAEAWDADASSPEAVGQRVEEIAWVVTLIYGVGGWRKGKPYKADFFTYLVPPLFTSYVLIVRVAECIWSLRVSSFRPYSFIFLLTQSASFCAPILPYSLDIGSRKAVPTWTSRTSMPIRRQIRRLLAHNQFLIRRLSTRITSLLTHGTLSYSQRSCILGNTC